MTKENRIRHWAHLWWNFDQTPPVDIRIDVMKYIQEHPDEFKGAKPQ
jgi:hypothetical protein